MKFSSTFKELNRKDTNIAGGKGASLGEMTQAGIPVPNGFVVLSTTFDHFLRETDLTQEIDAILQKVDHKTIHTIESASEKIRGLIEKKEVPEDIASEVKEEFKKLEVRFVAVRSSATAEDGAEHAWAGQLDSFLNTTEENLLENVKKCWSSLFTPRAIFYRFEKEFNSTQISVAVVVQKMIQSEISGVAFSVHPITEDHNQLIIEAGFGLGEAIVSGAVTPDSYVAGKEPRKIIDINVNTQKRGLFGLVNGGNEWREIIEPQASSQVLNEKQISELTNLVIKIENHYGFPCDIEWAYEGGKFYIVQSRPITTLLRHSKSIPEPMSDIESYIAKQDLVSLGRRASDVFEAKLKIIGWSKNFSKEFGIGHKTILINSLGEQFGDEKSRVEINNFFQDKDISYARHYIDKMVALNEELVENIPTYPERDYTERLSYLFTYFEAIRRVIESIYEQSSEEIKAYIDEWRNNPNIFSSLDKFYEIHPQNDPVEWSLVGIDGNISLINKVITFGAQDASIYDEKEIKGIVGYPGIISGVARVVMTKKERDATEEGDIIVAPMTTVDFLPAMKKAIAFVTDEGGITCHAAIVAREMKKPCIIATKVGSKVIKTGDRIEVDANQGVVRILS